MDITLQWSPGSGYLPIDGWNVYYREYSYLGLNNWILLTDPSLDPSTTSYVVTGLTPNVKYEFAIAKSCIGVFDVLSQATYINVTCPVVSTWQGPVVNGYPTLFYSLYYSDGNAITASDVKVYNTTPVTRLVTNVVGDGIDAVYTTLTPHGLSNTTPVTITNVDPPDYNVVNSTVNVLSLNTFSIPNTSTATYVSDGTIIFNPGMLANCGTSSTMLVGRSTYIEANACSGIQPLICGTDRIYFDYPNSTHSAIGYMGFNPLNKVGSTLPAYCDDYTNPNNPILLDYNTILTPHQYRLGINQIYPTSDRSNLCDADNILNVVTSFTFDDDALATYRNLNSPNYLNLSATVCYDPVALDLKFSIEDGTGRTDINQYTISYGIYDTVSAGPYPYYLDNGTLATSNHVDFRVFGEIPFNSSYTAYISADMTIDIKFNTNVPGTITILSISNVDYSGYTLYDFLSDIASRINTIGAYSAVVVNLGSNNYRLRIYHSDVTIESIDISVDGPNTPLIFIGDPLMQVNYTGSTSGITSAFEYNGFLYGARGNEITKSNIQVTDIANGTTLEYQHTIDFPINQIELVPVTPPSEVFDLKLLQSAGSASYTLTVDNTRGLVYIIDNDTIYVHNATDNVLIDSATFLSIDPSMTYTYRYISVIESTGDILLFAAPAGGPANVDVIQFGGVGAWTYSTTYTYSLAESGGIVYNPITTFVYLSIGLGQVAICDASGIVATVQLLEPDGITNATGAFHLAVYDTGSVYLIKRDSITTPSKHIYSIDTLNNPGVIDGSLTYDDYICGNISIIDNLMYFTIKNSRIVVQYNVISQQVIEQKIVPSLYKKMEGVNGEYAQGAIFLSGSKFVMMNRMNNNNTPGTFEDYQVTNLFVYDYPSNSIVQSLIGGPNDPYTGSAAGWNTSAWNQTFGWDNAGANQNYCYSIGIVVSDIGFIYFKPSLNNRVYVSTLYNETGVAQLWATYSGLNQKNLIRIFNIQNDGSLVSSARNIYQNSSANLGNGICNMKFDSYYNSVIVNGFLGTALNLFDVTNFSGYAGSNYIYDYFLTSESYVGNQSTIGIYWPQRVLTNQQGSIAVFGPHYLFASNKFGYANFSTVDLTTQVTNPVIDLTGDGSSNGLYNTDSLPQLYVPSTNTYWIMGRSLYSAGDYIINIYDAATSGYLLLVASINLSTSGYTLPIIGGSNMIYLDSSNHVVLYDNFTKLFIDVATNTILQQLTVTTSGSLVPVGSDVYMDYLPGAPNEEAWGLIGSSPIISSANTYRYITVTYEDPTTSGNTLFYDVYGDTQPVAISDTFGQWKEIDNTNWTTIPSSISVSLGTILEFTSFIINAPLVQVRNITQATTYTLGNSLNNIPSCTITADLISLNSGDQLEFEFTNPIYPTCPYINTTTITIT